MTSAPKRKHRAIRIPLDMVKVVAMYNGYLNIEIKESPVPRKKKKPSIKGDQE